MIIQAGRANPDARIVVTGCHADFAPDQLARLPGVEWVIGNRRKDDLVRQVSGKGTPPYEREPLARELCALAH